LRGFIATDRLIIAWIYRNGPVDYCLLFIAMDRLIIAWIWRNGLSDYRVDLPQWTD
jgi:hypothetical protein